MQASPHPVSHDELMAYLDGELSADRAGATAAHLEHCRECQSFAADLQVISRRLLDWQIDEPSSVLDARVREAMAVKPSAERPRRKVLLSFIRMPWAWGAVIVAIFLFSLMRSQRLYMRAPLEERVVSQLNAPSMETK